MLCQIMCSTVTAYAAGSYEVTVTPDAHDPDKVAGAFGGILCMFAQGVGLCFVILGIYGFLKNFILKENGEIKSKDIVFIVTGCLLFGMRIVLQQAQVVS